MPNLNENDSKKEESVAAGSSEKDKLAELKSLRSSTKGNITRIRKLISTKGETFMAAELECRLGILESYWKQVLNVQLAIERINAAEEAELKESFRSEVEDVYVATKARIMELLKESKGSLTAAGGDSLNTTMSTPATIPVARCRLEQIKLPKFSGKFSEYPNFIGLFKSLVDKDETLDSLQKLNYLKQSLVGPALDCIKEFDMVGSSYRKVLDRLEDRFDNKYQIFQEHIHSLLAVPKVSKVTSGSLRNLQDSFNTHLNAMLSSGSYENITHSILISLALDRVDSVTQSKWQDAIDYSKLPSWDDFKNVLDRRCLNLEASESKPKVIDKPSDPNPPRENRFRPRHGHKPARPTTLAAQGVPCAFCKAQGHKIYACTDFQNLSVANRFLEVKKLMLCINCLEIGHSVRRCNKDKCSICLLPHHRLLHRFSVPASADPVSNAEPCTSSAVSLLGRTKNQVVLATAMIEVRDRFGVFHPVRALLDSASQLNFVTERVAQRLKLKKTDACLEISGIGKEVSKIRHRTEAVCKARISDFKIELELLVIKAITDLQPNKSFSVADWKIPNNIVLADPKFNEASPIDMLIGAECFFELLSVGQIKMEGLPILQKTLFGWVVSGKYDLDSIPNAAVCLVGGQAEDFEEDVRLSEMVEQFWKVECVDSKKSVPTPEETRCEEHFLKTITRNKEGRFVVRMPFKESPALLGDSYQAAMKRFLVLEKKLERNPEVKEEYCKFLKEYEDMGHMQEVPQERIGEVKYLCPHQCVLRPESSTTKLRVVFDCSASTSSGMSLNDILLKGPVVQDTLFEIVLRFRCYLFVVTADISKMYRRVEMDPGDRKYQCIIWREKPTGKVKVFQLNTVTYGTKPAPYQATRCLKLLAEVNRKPFPLGSKVVEEDFYMDDLISGGDTVEEVHQIRKEVNAILESGGFQLRKWWTNEPRLLDQIPDTDKEVPLRINDSDVIKTLGLKWNPVTDHLEYVPPNLDLSKRITKRRILKELSSLFDPLGLVNPVVVKGKIILQSLWVKKTKWDESVQAQTFCDWEQFRSHLKELENIKVPRYVLRPNHKSLQIHGFADASLKAYGCCVYLRTTDEKGNVASHLLSAKSKVAPIKTQSLPRLELCAAELLVVLLRKILPNLPYLIDEMYLWTDSEIVLCWLSAQPATWDVFIANRVSKIQTELPSAIWRHVSSKKNPADIVSRGAYPEELRKSMWFSGPDFLYLPEHRWPQQKDFSAADKDLPGKRRSNVTLHVSSVCKDFAELYLRSSDFQKTCRIVAIIVKFINSFQRVKRRGKEVSSESPVLKPGPKEQAIQITANELDEALHRIIWHIQQESFKGEIEQLTKGEMISPKSVVKKLNPVLDDSSLMLLRVGGRLQNADIPYTTKCPILLPKSHLFVYNLALYLHRKNYHAGPQALVGILRQRFWVIDVRRLAKKVVDRCLHCFKYRPRLLTQLMGHLPSGRVQPARPFSRTGVDFCGPFYITLKLRGQRICKAYVAVFVCFVVKAVHLEVVSDLSSQSFIAALKRFVARRGLCHDLFCDNGTNFVGAKNELKELKDQFLEQQIQKEIADWCTSEHINFHHIPPRAPHFGGLWEAAVKSAKNHLLRTVGQASLTFEELSTVVADIEAILNSRPLCVMSTDLSDEPVLTPGHFLVGGPLNAVPEPWIEDNLSCVKRWRRLTQIKQHFWQRWSKEYLLELQKRAKWNASSENVKVGTLAMISDDNTTPQQWLVGRIVDTVTATDGKVRVVDLKTKNGVVRRAIHRLAPLPIED